MDPEIKNQWVAALRSGNYKQGRDRLYRPATHDQDAQYCCLGVLCIIAEKQNVVKWKNDEEGFIDPKNNADFSDATLPVVVRDWAGLSECNPEVCVDEESNDSGPIGILNDNGYTFDLLADFIETQL